MSSVCNHIVNIDNATFCAVVHIVDNLLGILRDIRCVKTVRTSELFY